MKFAHLAEKSGKGSIFQLRRVPVEVEDLLDEQRELAREADAVAVGDLG